MTPWPVEGIVHPGLTAMTGLPERGKTTLALSLVKAILAGREWAGHPTNLPEDRQVLFMSESVSGYERARGLLQDRTLHGICKRWDDRADLPAVVQREGIGFVVIDSLYGITRDENDQAEAADVLSALQLADCPVMVIHHLPKSGGSTAAGVQRYSAAYRHRLDVKECAAIGDSLAMTVKVSGNDLPPGTPNLSVSINWKTLDCVAVAEGVSDFPKAQRTRSSRSEQDAIQVYAKMAAGLGVKPGTAAGTIARALVGTDERPNIAARAELKAAGLPATTYRRVSARIKKDRAAFEAALKDAETS